MDTKTKAFTKAELRADAVNLTFVFAKELGRMFLFARSLCLLGIGDEVLHKHEDDDQALLAAVEARAEQFEFVNCMLALYDYGCDATLYGEALDWVFVEEDLFPFFQGIRAMQDFLEVNATIDFRLDRLQYVIELGMARRFLEAGSIIMEGSDSLINHLTLRQVALLAGLDEKTVRNLANPKAKNHLKTVSLNGRTYVECAVAEEWLLARGFKKTTFRSSNLDRDISKTGFWSLADLGAYIRARREHQGKSVADVATHLGEPGASAWLEALEQGNLEFDLTYCSKLAELLEIDPKTFTLAALTVFQKEQLARTEKTLAGPGVA